MEGNVAAQAFELLALADPARRRQLSFLRFGIQPRQPIWGNMLSGAQELIWQSPWLAIWPGVLILVTVIAFYFPDDALRSTLAASGACFPSLSIFLVESRYHHITVMRPSQLFSFVSASLAIWQMAWYRWISRGATPWRSGE
jgi:hypothetical protein